MTKRDYFFSVLEAVFWYAFLYFFLYSIKYDVNLFVMSFVLLVLVYAASISCPLMRYTSVWMRLFGHKRVDK